MRILFLNFEFPPLGGGASPVSFELARRYVGRGHAVHVVTMGYRGLAASESMDGVQVTRVPCLRASRALSRPHELLSYLLSAGRFLHRLLRKQRFDVNHTHFLVPTGILAERLQRRHGLPFVISAHGSDVPGFNPDRFRLLHLLTGSTLRSVTAAAERVITPSEYLAGLLRHKLGEIPPGRLVTIPNGIDAGAFVPGPKRPVILFTGRLLPRKGAQHLVQALAGEDTGYEIHICGDGPLRAGIARLAAGAKTPVVFHGWLDNTSRRYHELLASAAIFALPSARENASVALLEAMSAGCAVLTADTTGCPETVGEAGLTVPPGDVAAIREACLRLIRDAELRTDLQRRARERVREHFDWERIVDRYEQELVAAASTAGRMSLIR